jgi:hypothetical protein
VSEVSQETSTNREARELAAELRELQPKVAAAVAYADSETSLEVERAVYALYATTHAIVVAGVAMGGD